MRIVKLKGGLGNQMFQYCFAKLVEQKTKDVVKLDLSAYRDLEDDRIRVPRILQFHLSLPVATRRDLNTICRIKHTGNSQTFWYRAGIAVEKIINSEYYFERNRAYRSPNQIIMEHRYFDGYWQSYRYVNQVWDLVSEELHHHCVLQEKTMDLIHKMQRENSVFVGVRRGDYSRETKHYGSFGQDYYEQAMEYIEQRVSNPVYYIFSNDIEWVKGNLFFRDKRIIYREKEEIVDDFEELILMSHCKHSIIANSTYHWWGSRLNEDKGKIVIAPKKWFFDDKPIDIVPKHWVRI